MMPAQFMLGTIAMLTDALPESFDFFNKLLTRHPLKICVHILLLVISDATLIIFHERLLLSPD